MIKQKKPAINVTIYYGNNLNEIIKMKTEKLRGKKSIAITENEISGCKIIPPVDIDNIEIIALEVTSMLNIENFVTSNYITVKKLKDEEYYEVSKSQIVLSSSSFQPADISYFGAMENVELVPCFYQQSKMQ